MNLYCQLPFGQCNSRNKLVVEVAGELGRTPGSLSMKLGNLASLDPAQKLRGIRGIKGLNQASKADQAIWDEFQLNWSDLVWESEQALQNLLYSQEHVPKAYIDRIPLNNRITEKHSIVKQRRGQDFFRKTVLAAYNGRCCVTGSPIPELLRASHILPWSEYPEHRLNPCNGLCLGVVHDAAFDKGLITFNKKNKLLISRYLSNFFSHKYIAAEFATFQDKQINLPDKFLPDPAFLTCHHDNIFVG